MTDLIREDESQSEILHRPVEDYFTRYVLCGGQIVSSRTHTLEHGTIAVYHIDTRAFVGHLIKELPPIASERH